MRPASEVLPPAVYEALTNRRPGQRGPGKKAAKVAVKLRIDPDVLSAFKADGEGWQSRMKDALREAVSRKLADGGSRAPRRITSPKP